MFTERKLLALVSKPLFTLVTNDFGFSDLLRRLLLNISRIEVVCEKQP